MPPLGALPTLPDLVKAERIFVFDNAYERFEGGFVSINDVLPKGWIARDLTYDKRSDRLQARAVRAESEPRSKLQRRASRRKA